MLTKFQISRFVTPDFTRNVAQCVHRMTGTKAENTGVIWDPVNSFIADGEQPRDGAVTLGSTIKHVHIKDVTRNSQGWNYDLPGNGQFPLTELLESLKALQYASFLSFEWEKQWHPELADAEIALPHFANWFHGLVLVPGHFGFAGGDFLHDSQHPSALVLPIVSRS